MSFLSEIRIVTLNPTPETTETPRASTARASASRASSAQRGTPGRRERRPKPRRRLRHYLLFPFVFIWSELLLRLFCDINLFRTVLYPLLFALAAGLICTALTSCFSRKTNRIISLVLLYPIAIYFSTEALIRSSFQVFMSPADIVTGTGGVVGGFGAELIRSIFYGLPKIVLFVLPALLYTFFGRFRMPARRYRPMFGGMLLLAAVLLHVIMSMIAANGSQKNKYSGQFNFNTATATFGLVTSTRLSFTRSSGSGESGDFVLDTEQPEDTTGPSESAQPNVPVIAPTVPETTEPVPTGDNVMELNFKNTSSETIQGMNEYVQSLTPSNKNAYTGLFEGKNLIYICAEAYCDSFVSEELTPTLYRLIHNGIYFSDFYQPTWGGSTSSGEFSMLFGIAPTNGVDSMQDTIGKNMYFTLANRLKPLGYHGNAYHDGDYDFYNRNKTHTNFGYDKFLAYGNGLDDLTGWWTGDIVMFDKTMDTYMDDEPFCVYYMTISGHCTYLDTDEKTLKYIDRVKSVVGDRYKQTTLNYICYQMELEEALKKMIEKLEAKGIADDTVIVMTGDHYPYGLEKSTTFKNFEDYVTDLYGYKYHNSWEQDHNNLILWSGCLENEHKDKAVEISEPCYSLDIVPTLLNLFGLEFDSRLLVGRDVFSDAEPLVLWTNYSWITTKGKYDSSEGTFYPNDGVEYDESYVEKINRIVSNKLSFSGKVLKTDYYAYLFE